jgi:murein DD-endopeptidase MepM/ murein hydrolase activator NlpD
MRGHRVLLSCLLPLLISALALTAADSQYTIKEGETLFSIARRAQVPVDVLSAYNGIADAAKVRVGTVLRVPTVYTVKKGDTLYGIARSFGVPIGKIFDLNKIGSGAKLKVGERIYIPLDSEPPTVAVVEPVQKARQPDPAAVQPAASAMKPMGVVVWPHPGRHEPDNGKIPGLVFYGAAGDVVRSATAGEVKWAATYWTRGKVVIIKSSDGTLFTYGGNAELLVNVGDRVSAGMDIAKLGESPQGGGAKLYFSISDSSGRALNPERFFSAKSDS